MTEHIQAPVPTDAELRALWQQAGGTFYSSNYEIGSMPVRKLIPFLRRAGAPAPDVVASPYEIALRALVGAACPGVDSGNLLEDARKATEAFAGAELAGHFGVDDKPTADGAPRYVMVASLHAGDPDIVPLYRRAALMVSDQPPARKGGKATGAKGGAS